MDYKPIIESRYNRQNWQNLLHDIFQNRIQFWASPFRVDINNDTAKCAYYLGKIQLADGKALAIYEVSLSDSVIIERNKVSIRNLLVSHWKSNGFAGAFMFCFKQNESVLRFSYVSEILAFNADGKLGTEATDTKRFTYYLGEGHRSRTAIERFTKLKNSEQTLNDITKAFSVEALSDAFFAGYKDIYEDIVEYMTGKRMSKVDGKWKEIDVHKPNAEIADQFAVFDNPLKSMRDYVKKLMGRLVFLQFLQKKGWLGVKQDAAWGTGDSEFMLNLFNNSKHQDDFIEKVLEPLFNDINTKRENDLVTDANVGVGIKIPFLNGGLFERDKEDETVIKLPSRYFEKLFEFFGQYNFTIDENDPNDTEVGVDPEMLGRIFENLLEDNKDKGAFYTPKEIVRYMCSESLVAYLQTDVEDESEKEAVRKFVSLHDVALLTDAMKSAVRKKLVDVKICDPAIGSGAFPIGLLNELFACMVAIDGEQANRAEIKKHIIQNNIYGVDIEKGAVDIARLRFWLSLIVDENSPTALPNLDFKIMQGNSLLEQYGGIDLSQLVTGKKVNMQMDIFDNNLNQYRSNLNSLIKEYFNTNDHARKLKLKKQIQENVNNQMKAADIDVDFTSLGIDVANNDQFFLWHTWFADVFNRPNGCNGFDIVIGNPPYVIVSSDDRNKRFYDTKFQVASGGKRNLFHLFFEQGLIMTKKNGVLSYITPDTYFSSNDTETLRKYFYDNANIQSIIHYTEKDKVFENVKQAVAVIIMIKQHFENYFTIKDGDDIKIIEYSSLKESNKYVFKSQNLSIKKMDLCKKTFGDVCTGYKGDVNLGIKKAYFSSSSGINKLALVRGNQISRYSYRPGCEYCSKDALSKDHTQQERIVFKEVANMCLVHRVKGVILQNVICGDTCNILFSKNQDLDNKFILGILNSKAINFYFKFFNQTNHVPIGEIKRIPFPLATVQQQSMIISIVNKILEQKNVDPSSDTSALEHEIDQLVYQLYGLTEDEIAIVERN